MANTEIENGRKKTKDMKDHILAELARRDFTLDAALRAVWAAYDALTDMKAALASKQRCPKE